jgi:hypothetical protein
MELKNDIQEMREPLDKNQVILSEITLLGLSDKEKVALLGA